MTLTPLPELALAFAPPPSPDRIVVHNGGRLGFGLKDSAVSAGGVVSNDERDVRRWRLGQLGQIAETALWMLVVNALAHERVGGGDVPAPSPAEKRKVHEELLELFETRLDEHAALWESLVRKTKPHYL